MRNHQAIERCRMTCDCWYRQLRHPASRTINQAELARYNFGKPDASPGITCHREDLRLWIGQVVECDTARGGIEVANGAACQVAEPDLPIMCHREAERQSGELWSRRRDNPGLDHACGRIKPSNAPSRYAGKPEVARSVELESLRPQWVTIAGAQREDAKRLLLWVKAPDVVSALLNEPDVPPCVYGGGHDAILPIGRRPGRDHACA